MISELEDERRWARLREGIWLAILIHVLVLSAVTWIPKYVFKVPPVIDPFDAIKQRKDLSYLDLPPDALRQLQPKVKIKPVPEKAAADRQKDAGGDEQADSCRRRRSRASNLRCRIPFSLPPTPPPSRKRSPSLRRRSRRRSRRGPTLPWALRIPPTSCARPCAMQRAAPGTERANLPSDGGLSMHPGAGTGGVRGPIGHAGRGLQLLAAALAPRDRAHLGPADSRRGQSPDSQVGERSSSASRCCPMAA